MQKSEDCRHLLASLSDYLDGNLGAELCVELERHLAECRNCQIIVDTLRKTILLYRASSSPPPVPDEVRERLYKRLELDDLIQK